MKRYAPWIVIAAFAVLVVYGAVRYMRGPAKPVEQAKASSEIPAPPEPGPNLANIPGQLPKPLTGPETAKPPAKLEPAKPTAADVYQQAISADEKGDTAAAARLYQKVVQLEPGGEAAAQAAVRLAVLSLAKGEKLAARDYYSQALKANWSPSQRQTIVDQLTKLNEELVFTPGQAAGTAAYTVKRGDCLANIAKQYKITVAMLRKLNNIEGDMIRADEQLKVITGPFDAIVDKSDLTLTVSHNGKFIKQYPVGLGKDNGTPIGTYQVTSKLIDPDWFTKEGVVPSDSPDNILGTRWIGFHRGYGIHGTTEPDSIGKYSSNGCIRMLNKDVEEVYDLVVTRHSKITIQE